MASEHHRGLIIIRFISTSLFFLFFLGYTWKILKPILFYQRQEPVYLNDSRFFQTFLSYPGGLVEYTSNFLSQLYLYPFAGALLLTALLGAAFFLTARYLNNFNTGMPLIPIFFLAVMHNHYKHPIAVGLGILLALGFAVLFQRIPKNNPVFRISFLFLVFPGVYYLAAGFVLFFGLLCLLDTIPNNKIELSGFAGSSIVIILLSLGLPYLAYLFIFQISLNDAFFYLLPVSNRYPFFSPYLFFMTYPLLWGLGSLQWDKILQLRGHMNRDLRQTVFPVLVGAGGVFLWFSFDSQYFAFLSIDYYASQADWEEVLRVAGQKSTNRRIAPVSFLINQALCQKGVLLEEMFRYPQSNGLDGLVLLGDVGLSGCMPSSDFYFRMGHLNEARHWGHEALSITGETPRILERLFLVNLLLEDYMAANKFLSVLKKYPFRKNRIGLYARWMANPETIELTPELVRIKSFAPPEDFIINRFQPIADIQRMMNGSPENRMAVDYYMAWYLIKARIGMVLKNISKFREAGYTHLPRHVEEAFVYYMMRTGQKDLDLHGYQIRKQTLQRFSHFSRLLAENRSTQRAAMRALYPQHGDTFWYYVMFHLPDEYKKLS